MVISKEIINSRVAELIKKEQELRSELNAVVGAIQDCGYWMAILDKSDEMFSAD
jgi:hypothetical protein